MGTRSWDTDLGITQTGYGFPAADPATATIHQVLLERLVDELSHLDRIAWADAEVDVAHLRGRLDEVMRIACAALDLVAPVRGS